MQTTKVTDELDAVPAWIIRGGTSKGVYLREDDLPEDRSLWGPLIIEMFGAQDARQINGIGGAMPTSSKCCIVGPSSHPEADVDYTFAQVGIGEERVYWDFNCGNLTPSVGTYAILAGLVEPRPGSTTVRIYQTNTRILLSVEVPTGADGSPLVSGRHVTAGVAGTGPAVSTDFSRAGGASLARGLFPSGSRQERLTVPGVGEVRCSIVDLANMCVFFRAEDAGLTGLEMPVDGPRVADTFTAIRLAAQRRLGIDPSRTTPWPFAVTEPQPYTTMDGTRLGADDYDVAVRFAGIQPMRDTLHEASPGTASSCVAFAAVANGTVVNEIYGRRPHPDGIVRIAHPSGVLIVSAAAHDEGERCVVDRVVIERTVRPIMRGELLVRKAEIRRLAEALGPDDPTRAAVPGGAGAAAA